MYTHLCIIYSSMCIHTYIYIYIHNGILRKYPRFSAKLPREVVQEKCKSHGSRNSLNNNNDNSNNNNDNNNGKKHNEKHEYYYQYYYY